MCGSNGGKYICSSTLHKYKFEVLGIYLSVFVLFFFLRRYISEENVLHNCILQLKLLVAIQNKMLL